MKTFALFILLIGLSLAAQAQTKTFADMAAVGVSKTGSYTGSGTLMTTSYVVTHNLGTVPGIVLITPTSSAASGFCYVSAKTATTFTITFLSAPGVGTNNLTFDWIVRIPAS